MNEQIKKKVLKLSIFLCALAGVICLGLWVFSTNGGSEITVALLNDDSISSSLPVVIEPNGCYTVVLSGFLEAGFDVNDCLNIVPSLPIDNIISEYEIVDVNGKVLLKGSGDSFRSHTWLSRREIAGKSQYVWMFEYSLSSFLSKDFDKVFFRVVSHKSDSTYGIQNGRVLLVKDFSRGGKYALYGFLLLLLSAIIYHMSKEYHSPRIAGTCCIVRRYLASGVDISIILLLIGLLNILIGDVDSVVGILLGLIMILFVLIVPEIITKQTLGSFIFNIKIVPQAGRYWWCRIIVRRFINIIELVGYPFFYYYLSALSKTGRTLSDRISGCDMACSKHLISPEINFPKLTTRIMRFVLATFFMILCLAIISAILSLHDLAVDNFKIR